MARRGVTAAPLLHRAPLTAVAYALPATALRTPFGAEATLHHELDLILTMTLGLAAALAFGLLSQRLRLSPIVGYLVAGIVVGPFTPGLVVQRAIADQLAELGVILLMFGVGLHFDLRDLLAVKRIAVPGALVQSAVATGLGLLVARAFGWPIGPGVVYGLALSVASTVVLLRVLSDHDALHTPPGHAAVGWLIVEDLFTVLVLVMLPVVAGRGATSGGVVAVAVALAKVATLLAFIILAGRKALPWLLGYVARLRSRELFTLTVLVIALGIAVGSARLFGASMALGAFLAGMVVGQSEFSTRAASEALPMRDAFAVLFFVSMGMLLDPASILPNIPFVAASLAVILVGKPLAALVVVRALGYPTRTALTVAIALAQIGEFSFMLAAVGRELGLLPSSAQQSLVAAAIISITLNPFLFRLVEPLARRFPARRTAQNSLPPSDSDAAHRSVVIGHGPVGAAVTRLLRENGVEPTVVELNHDTVKSLRARGIRAIYGDASQREVLDQAGARASQSLVFAASGSPDAVIRQAMDLNPDLVVLTRATYVREAPALKEAGAHVVFTAELEVALAMAEDVLRRLGASDDQLDRARHELRSELDR